MIRIKLKLEYAIQKLLKISSERHMLFKNLVRAWLVKTEIIVENIDAYRQRDIKGTNVLVNILSPKQYCTIKVVEVTDKKQHTNTRIYPIQVIKVLKGFNFLTS